MRKICLLLVSFLSVYMIACNNAGTETTSSESKATNSMAEKNLASQRIVTDAFKSGDVSKIDSAVANDFVGHSEHGDMGRDSLKAMISAMKTQFPDLKMDIIKEVGDDEYVFTLMRMSGTSNGQMGMPAGPYDFHSLEVSKFKDGKAVEHWSYMQPKEMMAMMAPPKDTSKKK